MLTRKQHDVLSKIIDDTVNEIQNIYNQKLPQKKSAADIVASILTYLNTISDPKQVQQVMDDYPEAKKQIKLLGDLRFPPTAFATLNRYGKFVRDSKQSNDDILSKDIAKKSKETLSNSLYFQVNIMIPEATMADNMAAHTMHLENATKKSQERIDELNNKIKQHTEENAALKQKGEERRRETDALQKQADILRGVIRPEYRKTWIDGSPFKTDLESIQKTIDRLDSRLVYGGRAKAAKLKKAFEAALDAGVQDKFATFTEFLNYKKPAGYGLFENHIEPSLQDILNEHRHEWWDKLTNKNETKGLDKK